MHAYDSLPQRENGGHSKHPTEPVRINGVYSNWWRVSSVAHTAADSGCKHAVSMWSSLHTKMFQPFRGRKGATSRSRLIIIASVTTFAGLILICWSSSTFPQGGRQFLQFMCAMFPAWTNESRETNGLLVLPRRTGCMKTYGARPTASLSVHALAHWSSVRRVWCFGP